MPPTGDLAHLSVLLPGKDTMLIDCCTIDNYQGEESDIVIASLTRSNASRDIGFMKSQVLRIKSKVDTSIRQGTDLKTERLGLVLLGNPGTGQSLCRSNTLLN